MAERVSARCPHPPTACRVGLRWRRFQMGFFRVACGLQNHCLRCSVLRFKIHLSKWRFTMANISIGLFLLAILFYVQEMLSERPSFLRASVFLTGVVVATLSFSI
jgi:lysylphosphatidylglycerol synthetase-like protein (DUF2156 family)